VVKRFGRWLWHAGADYVILTWNVTWFVFNVQHWVTADGWWGWLILAFWIALMGSVVYRIGYRRARQQDEKSLATALEVVHMQSAMLKSSVNTTAVKVDETSREVMIHLGPICLN
jgi:hypothetical protein